MCPHRHYRHGIVDRVVESHSNHRNCYCDDGGCRLGPRVGPGFHSFDDPFFFGRWWFLALLIQLRLRCNCFNVPLGDDDVWSQWSGRFCLPRTARPGVMFGRLPILLGLVSPWSGGILWVALQFGCVYVCTLKLGWMIREPQWRNALEKGEDEGNIEWSALAWGL